MVPIIYANDNGAYFMSCNNSITVGNVRIPSRVFLAPLSGISDQPFRKIVNKYSTGLVYSEMIASAEVIRSTKQSKRKSTLIGEEGPIAVQLAGTEPYLMSEAAKILEERGAHIIDINFGCPVPKITNKGAGSGAMKNIDLMIKMAESVVNSSKDTPVTVKMRAGWSNDKIISTQAGKLLESAGIQAITLHPRTSKQRFTGRADWSLIKELKDNISIPVIGNGDISAPEDFADMIKKTNCDAAMVGRASLGNPWIFSQISDFLKKGAYKEASLEDKIILCEEHYRLLKEEKNEALCLNLTKKHYSWYLKGFPSAAIWRTKFMSCSNLSDIETVLQDMKENLN